MTGIETKIVGLLQTHLDSYVTANPIKVAYPGQAFIPASDKPWLRPWVLWAPPRDITYKGSQEYKGTFQVDVFYPEQMGYSLASEIAAALCVQFQMGTNIYGDTLNIRIVDPPYPAPAQQEPGWLQIPVNIPFRAYLH